MKLSVLVLLLIVLCQESALSSKLKKNITAEQTALYQVGAKTYSRGSYSESLKHYQEYLVGCKQRKCQTVKWLFAIDMIGSIYIRVQKDPSALIKFYTNYTSKSKFNDAIQDEIDEWINASREWLKNSKLPRQINNPEELIKLGDLFYQKGIKKKKYPMDRKGNAELSIAASYYVPYIYEFNDNKKVDQALLRMGVIRSTLWTDKEYWTQNFYLKEVIRRFPNSDVAKKAFQTLDEEIHFSYTGSAGDSTPPSQLQMLKYFKSIANGDFKKAKKIRNNLF